MIEFDRLTIQQRVRIIEERLREALLPHVGSSNNSFVREHLYVAAMCAFQEILPDHVDKIEFDVITDAGDGTQLDLIPRNGFTTMLFKMLGHK